MTITKRRPYVELGENCIRLFSRYEDKDLCKSIERARWNPKDRCWEYPLRSEALDALTATFPGLTAAPEVTMALAQIAERETMAVQIKATGWEKAEPVEPMPIKTKPFRHQ